MSRRSVIVLLSGVALAWLPAAHAQQGMPVIAFLHSGSPQINAGIVEAFRHGLKETGYTEGRNIKIEFRWAQDQNDRLPVLAAEFVLLHVAIIAGNGVSALAVRAVTTTIPVVFQSSIDPVKSGLVASLGHPGGNTTGVSFFGATMEIKKLELLHELIPQPAAIALLVNPNSPQAGSQASEVQAAASTLRRPLMVLSAGSERELDAAFAALVQQGAKAVVVIGDPLFNNRRRQLIALAARYAVPAIYSNRENIDEGGLISYGTSLPEAYRQVGIYVGRILKGAKPADLPVLQPTKFEMVVNLKTAKTLGLELPHALLDRADRVIE